MDSLSYLFFVSCQLVFVSLQTCSSQTYGWNSSLQPLNISNPLLQFLDLKRMLLYVSTWEVLEDGNVGLRPITSPSLLLIPLGCNIFRMLILLLQFLTLFIALTGHSIWPPCLKSPIILWFP